MGNPIHKAATTTRRDGDLAQAAEYYITLAAYKLAESEYQPSRKFRQGIAYTLLAMSLDLQCDNHDRTDGHRMFIREFIERLQTDSTEAVHQGFSHEWAGDVALLTGEYDRAVSEYETAAEIFDTFPFGAQWMWGASPEYDMASWAMEGFFSFHDIEYYLDHDIDFAGRVDWKREMVDKLRT